MKDITIDCSRIASPADLHRLFAEALAFPAHYGNNLDALHDCRIDLPGDNRIRLANWSAVETLLGKYAHNAKAAILDAAIQNPRLSVLFD